MVGLATGCAGEARAQAAPDWGIQQTFVESGPVHAPTFFTPLRGFAVVGDRLLHTIDGGNRWSVSLPAEWSTRLPEALSFGDPMHGWATGDGFIMASVDGGSHWHAQAIALAENHSWVAVRALDSTHAVAVSSDGGLLITSDGGATWTSRDSAGAAGLAAIWFADESHGWVVGSDAAGHGLVLGTGDGGATWRRQNTPMCAPLTSVTSVGNQAAWAAGTGALLRTSNGGSDWTALASPVPPGSAATATEQGTSLAFPSQSHGFLGTSVGGAYLFETRDGGTTWSAVSAPGDGAQVADVLALDGAHVLATGAVTSADADFTDARIWSWSQTAASATPSRATVAAPKRQVVARPRVSARRGLPKTRRH